MFKDQRSNSYQECQALNLPQLSWRDLFSNLFLAAALAALLTVASGTLG